ncbi:MAG TPA: hypothetical protein DIT05_14595 [Morganella sp. (in: Bacteria)]|nr:hypothetical protein [Morganella sp. (in: enterobacteria)]
MFVKNCGWLVDCTVVRSAANKDCMVIVIWLSSLFTLFVPGCLTTSGGGDILVFSHNQEVTIMNDESFAELYQNIQRAVFPAYKAIYGQTNTAVGDRNSAKMHSYMLLILEIYIAEYREKHKKPFMKLAGDSAMRHAILSKYHYSFDVLNTLTLQQMVFALLEDLHLDNFWIISKRYLTELKLHPDLSSIDWSLKINWNLGDGADYLLKADTE